MSFLTHLNPVQQEAVKATGGPVMIIAGAGSGKTRVLTYRAAYLLHNTVRADAVLALTFTNKAAEEMKARIRTLVGEAARYLWMGTFHSVFARILRTECEHVGYQRNFSIYDTDDTLSLIKSIMSSRGISQQQFTPQGIRSRISTAKNQMLSPRAYAKTVTDPFAERAAAVYGLYQKKLHEANAMDFDDLLLKPLELFTKHPEILERYQYRFKYILVDEYQDTNRVQYTLIKVLAAKYRNICVVGDDAQSIYAFRGADIRNILDFERDYPDCKTYRLEQNYRSTKTILAAAGSLIKNNVDQIAKSLWTDNSAGEQIVLMSCEDDREEGYRIVQAMEEESRRKKLDLKDFAVLYRTNAQSRSIEDALRRNGIPYIIVGGVAFYKRREIKDVLAYLRVLANPRDEESLLRILNFPARSIGDTTVGKLRVLAARRETSLFDVLAEAHTEGTINQRAVNALRQFHLLLQKYIGLRESMSVSELAHALVDDIGVLRILKEENTPESLARRENILELISALKEYTDQHQGAKLEDFLEEVSLVSDVDTADFGHNAVTLMTLHSAKGLEFPVVFITGLEEGLFPLSNSSTDKQELEEERRLMYVGITRAMRKLYLSYAQRRYRSGEMWYSVKSRFLDEMDQSLLSVMNGTTRRQVAYQRATKELNVPVRSRDTGAGRRRKEETREFFPDSMPAYEDESQEVFRARVGARVVHEAFGKGRVVAIDGSGENTRAVVEFDSVGRKHLMLKFAHLRSA